MNFQTSDLEIQTDRFDLELKTCVTETSDHLSELEFQTAKYEKVVLKIQNFYYSDKCGPLSRIVAVHSSVRGGVAGRHLGGVCTDGRWSADASDPHAASRGECSMGRWACVTAPRRAVRALTVGGSGRWGRRGTTGRTLDALSLSLTGCAGKYVRVRVQ